LDFVLREREPGAPLVSTMLWAVDPANPEHEGIIEGWQHPSAEAGTPSPFTKVNRCLAEGRARLRQLGAMP
jgi:hypothetical protein